MFHCKKNDDNDLYLSYLLRNTLKGQEGLSRGQNNKFYLALNQIKKRNEKIYNQEEKNKDRRKLSFHSISK